MDKTDIIIFGALICIVIILFITVCQNKKIGNVIQTLNRVENFDDPTTTRSEPYIQFKTICGDIQTIATKVQFYNADDYHIIVLKNMPNDFFKTESITVNFIYNVSNDITIYTGKELSAIKNDENEITLKQTLIENAKYVLKLTTKEGNEVKFNFITDYNTFTYIDTLTNLISDYDTASRNLLLGIKQKNTNDYTYQVAKTAPETFTPDDGKYIYDLRIPDFNVYIGNVITQLKQNNSGCIEEEYKELSKYIPFKFDAVLSVDRVKDAYPLENVILPSIKCIPSDNCTITLRNLRKNTNYRIRIRLIYFKVGSVNNYRSCPIITWSFNTGDTGDTFFETLDQIANLIKTVKNSYINKDNFNKDQDIQNNRLNAIEKDMKEQIRPLFK